ncbi:hypothetical protein [Mycolicibacterium iranicum]|uniref:4Fe-4S Wbl-type domain-containing protein n=1 Tax=Mycolicibacterium iranicum TaxID=912594 RepID=A0ABT4HK49_MYCIR|nr:hypothetical protein [Mycolicibacterium iranicum]MCZ0730474.1 hypothetical protein [Mycolicibacterium iranicum]
MSRAALLCWVAGPDAAATVPVTFWADCAEAMEALAELTPCSSDCQGRHTVVIADVDGRIRCRSFGPLSDDPLTTHRRALVAEARSRLARARAAEAAQRPGDEPDRHPATDGSDCVETQRGEEN